MSGAGRRKVIRASSPLRSTAKTSKPSVLHMCGTSIGAIGSSVVTTITVPGAERLKRRRAISAGIGHLSPRRSKLSGSGPVIAAS